MIRKSSFAGILGLLAWVPLAVADTLPTVADSQINLTAVAAKGGALTTLTVKNTPGPAYRAFAKFDLTALPPNPPNGPPVVKATLRLWTSLVTSEGDVEIAAVLGPWDEASLAAIIAPDLSASLGSFEVTKARQKTYLNVDVTQLVNDWKTGALANHGLALLGGSDDVHVRFDSKESLQTSHPMELEVILPVGTGGDITGVVAGFGLTGGGNTGNVGVAVNSSVIQRRVTGSCNPGWSIRAVSDLGAVTCEPDDVGPSVSVVPFSGPVSSIPGGASGFAFFGPTPTVTLVAGQRVTGSAEAPLGLASGTASLRLGLCYQPAAGGTITNFAGPSASFHHFSNVRASYSAAAVAMPGAGAWRVGMCVFNSSAFSISNNSYVNGWFLLTN